MDFTIDFKPPQSKHKIETGNPIFSMGSCFAQHWGNHLSSLGWPSLTNPLGIVYNPVSLQYIWEYLLGEKSFREEDWFENQDLWHQFDLHGSLSHPDLEHAQNRVEGAISNSREFLKKAEFGILTLGTASVFIEKESGQVVNNCHKISADQFRETQLSVQDCIVAMRKIRQLINENTSIRSVIWTVSPIRHIRRGLIRNTRSKARLILAVEEILTEFPQDHYFPSYELLMDVYRDHRYFKEDHVHPREEILHHIYDTFVQSCFDDDAINCWEELKAFDKMKRHRMLHPGTQAAKAWEVSLQNKKQQLKQTYTWLDLDQPTH